MTVSSISSSSEVPILEQEGNTNLDYLDIPATVATIGLSIILIPESSVGVAVSVAVLAGNIALSIIFFCFSPLPQVERRSPLPQVERRSEYWEFIVRSSLFATSVVYPCVEEFIFRKVMQGSIKKCIEKLYPTVTSQLFGYQIALASLVSITVTALLFGYMHTANRHADAGRQAFCATIGGVALGILAEQYGVAMSILSHMVNNFIACGAKKLIAPSTVEERGSTPQELMS